MKWLNMLRRMVGIPERPPAVSGAKSVLFVLQAKSPLTFNALQEQTEIIPGDLRRVLEDLEHEGRIKSVWRSDTGVPVRRYSITRRI